MTKRFVATLMAASIALTSVFSAPARAADPGEIGRILLGAGALFIIGNEIAKNNNKSRTVTRRYVEPQRYVEPHRHSRYVEPPRRVKPNRKIVPVACLRENGYRDGPARYFGKRCLQNNMRNANRLPSYCQSYVWGRNGQRTVYDARCLRRDGWTFG